MRFAVLGPLSVLDGQTPLAVNGEKQRLLLAILLSRGGEPVSVDALVDALWDDQPPDFPHKRLSWHIHRLRASLDATERIRRDDNGYALAMADCDVDAVEFERLCDTAAAALRGGDATEAAGTWTAALRLWRGPAYGDLGEHRLLRTDAARLAERRLRTLADRIGVDLDLGRHEELVGELTVLVAENPARERFRAQLMLALYRCGRRGEALDAYRDARRELVEQLGVEPGRELRELHRDLLRDAPRLAAPRPHPPSPATARPAELPAGSAAFTGRDPDLERLRALLSRPEPGTVVVSAVTGTGGVGKSALALRAARAVAHHYPDGQLYLNLRGATPATAPLEPVEALSRLLRSLGEEVPRFGVDADELAARFRSAVANRRLLLLLDGAADAAQVTPLLPGGPACGVIVTSRSTLSQLDGVDFVRLDVLTRDDALRLFERLTGHGESAATAEIVELCGRMPLAICVAAARLNTDPELSTADLAAQLRSRSRRLERLDDGQRAVGSTFAVSYDNLDAEAAALFRRLGLHPGEDFTAVVAAALAGVPVEHATALLARLVAAHLVEVAEPGRYAMHDLLRLFAAERAEADETAAERAAAVDRLLHAYLATARTALAVAGRDTEGRANLEPHRLDHPGAELADAAAARAWAVVELANLTAVGQHAVAAGRPEIAAALATALFPLLHTLGYWHRARDLCRIPADGDLPPSHRGQLHRDLAILELSTGSRTSGLQHAQHFLDACVAAADLAGQATALHLIGSAHRDEGRFPEAADCLRRSLDLCRRLGDTRLESMVCIGIGLLHVRTERHPQAATAFRRAAGLAEANGEHLKQIGAVGNLGHTLLRGGDPAAALATFQNGHELLARAGMTGMLIESDLLWGEADALHELDRPVEARRHRERSAALLLKLGHLTEAEHAAILATDRPKPPRVLS